MDERFLGVGRSRHFRARVGYHLEERGRMTYEVRDDRYHRVCDGVGCKRCKWTGESVVAEGRAQPIRRRRKKRKSK